MDTVNVIYFNIDKFAEFIYGCLSSIGHGLKLDKAAHFVMCSIQRVA